MKKIFEEYGIEILTENGKYYVKYDAGEIVEQFDTIEISESDAMCAQLSEKDAYDVILENQILCTLERCY